MGKSQSIINSRDGKLEETAKMSIGDNNASSLTVEEVIAALSDVTLQLTIIVSEKESSCILSSCD